MLSRCGPLGAPPAMGSTDYPVWSPPQDVFLKNKRSGVSTRPGKFLRLFPLRQIRPHNPNPLQNRFALQVEQHHAAGDGAQSNQNQRPADARLG